MNSIKQTPITVIGAGSWGTALAILLARNGQAVRLWGRDKNQLDQISKFRQNHKYLPDAVFPENLYIVSDLAEALQDVDDILIAVPSHAFRPTLQAMRPYSTHNTRIISAAKGFEPLTGKLLHECLIAEMGASVAIAILSGPTFAKEVAAGQPTAITIASTDNRFTQDLITRLHNPSFRVYTSTDVIGVQIGGAVKNVLAIASGITDGLGYGANARAALITRSLVELMRLGITLGGERETLMGLAGLGDLILTCTDNQSRNRRFGLAIGRGGTAEAAIEEIGQVVEGYYNTKEVYDLALRLSLEMPIVTQVYRILYEGCTPKDAAQELLMRELKTEKLA